MSLSVRDLILALDVTKLVLEEAFKDNPDVTVDEIRSLKVDPEKLAKLFAASPKEGDSEG